MSIVLKQDNPMAIEPVQKEWNVHELTRGTPKNKKQQAEMLVEYIQQNPHLTRNDRG